MFLRRAVIVESGMNQRRFSGSLAYPVDGAEDSGLGDKVPLQRKFAGKIHQCNTDEQGDYPLAGQHQHGDAR